MINIFKNYSKLYLSYILLLTILLLSACTQADSPDKTKSNNAIEAVTSSGLMESEVFTSVQETSQIPQTSQAPQTSVAEKAEIEGKEKLIVIDPGHQSTITSNQEPIGPGASEYKLAVSLGTQGVKTGKPEYQLNLEISLLLEKELKERGYQVELTRRENEVNISNMERAVMANNLEADAFLRVHANGSGNPNVEGMMTICQTSQNPYNAEFAEDSYKLSEAILEAMVASTGAVKEKIWQTDTMSGINWADVPVTIIEMGYMSNATEDEKLSNDEYQEKIVQGIADGLDNYFGF